uniref:Transposase n=1 Tax=Rhipicephalus appendiculatus TaxID=34631 RepID=A0A131Z1N1_RHIAP
MKSKRGEFSNIAKVVQRLEEDETLPAVSTTTTQRMLKQLGFKYKERSRNAFIIEATHIVKCRRRFLRSCDARFKLLSER